MGLAFVPFTFPTAGVAVRMEKALGQNVGYGIVDNLWDAYYLATTEEKLPAFNPKAGGKNAAALLNSMSKRTSIPKGMVSAWLNALYEEVQENGRDYYLDPATAEAASAGQVDPINHPLSTLETLTKSVGTSAANLVKPSADALTNIVKYSALAIVAGALVYGVYQGSKIFKARKRRKKG